jgi:hypothetical protein
MTKNDLKTLIQQGWRGDLYFDGNTGQPIVKPNKSAIPVMRADGLKSAIADTGEEKTIKFLMSLFDALENDFSSLTWWDRIRFWITFKIQSFL